MSISSKRFFIEAVVALALGYSISAALNLVLLPMFGAHVDMVYHLVISMLYAAIILTGQYWSRQRLAAKSGRVELEALHQSIETATRLHELKEQMARSLTTPAELADFRSELTQQLPSRAQ